MIEVEITERMIEYAQNLVPKNLKREDRLYAFGSEPKRIFEGGVGQACVMRHWGIAPCNVVQTYEFDLVYQEKMWECKTISCSYKPHHTFQASVNSPKEKEYRKQDCDNYIFIRILKDYSKGWIVGYINRDNFWENAILHPIGSNVKGMGVLKKAPLAEVKINQLIKVETFDEEKAESYN